MKISDKGKLLIKSFEGLRLSAYQDSAGVWTIGYGSTKYIDGKSVRPGDTLDVKQANTLFEKTLIRYESAVSHGVTYNLNQNQFDALVSFAYNLGTGVMTNSTLVRKLNSGDTLGAANQFLVWNKITDPVTHKKITSETLANRRVKERKLFLENYDTTK